MCGTFKLEFNYRCEAVQFNIKFGKRKGYSNVYFCKHCKKWHLSSRGKHKRKRLK